MTMIYRVGLGLRYFLARLLNLIMGFLALRIVLKFFGANSAAFIVDVFYDLTDIIIWPFQFIFPNTYWGSHLIDLVALCAIVGYVIIYFIALAILRIIFRE